ncbi:SUMF1/EgtB/PvdO family nonheme iron enzyme [Dietzia sp. SL131]|uniref:SUMF1/EgtB/PvdO family nonheme iron enzyme n=1 Tax=Dietzia sp. SL131 TaxID=2995149 RepID=UPI00227A5A4C|nr:SUMF1/EgtB/PvdO family nonheme iron enzyme [Dietzia sp. SL131]MCY1658232.1 SUMF1/EgtB/PvdO family nonheme iron enzyme [Dietzia sp. SL131]
MAQARKAAWSFDQTITGGYRVEPVIGRIELARRDLGEVWLSHRFLLLRGDAGMGKSTVLSRILHRVSEDYPILGTVPFLAEFGALESTRSLADYDSIEDLALEFFPSDVKGESNRSILYRAVQEERATLLLDDLPTDPTQRNHIMGLLNKFARRHSSEKNRLVVTSTLSASSAGSFSSNYFESYQLAPLADEDIVRYAMTRENELGGGASIDALLRTVFDDPDLRDLCSVPANLTSICSEWASRQVFSKIEVLEEIIWSRASKASSQTASQEKVSMALDALSSLAFSIKESGGDGTEFNTASLGQLSTRIGFDIARLLSPGVIYPFSFSRYAFSSGLIRDYLAARSLAVQFVEAATSQSPPSFGDWADERTIALCLGVLSELLLRPDIAEAAVKQSIADKIEANRILVVSQAVCRGLSKRLESALWPSLKAGLNDLSSIGSNGANRIAARRLLMRHSSAVQPGLGSLKQQLSFMPSGSIWLKTDQQIPSKVGLDVWFAKYPVTVGQFQEFIDDHGYRRRDLWTERGWEWVIEEHVARLPIMASRFTHPAQPVVGVTCYEAEAYCAWLQRRLEERFGDSSLIVRLPSEVEWIAAARGTTQLPSEFRSIAMEDVWNSSEVEWPVLDRDNPSPFRSTPWETGNEWPLIGVLQDAPPVVGTFPELSGPYGAEDLVGSIWQWLATSWGAAWDGEPAPLGQSCSHDDVSLPPDVPRMVRGGSYLVTSLEGGRESNKHLSIDYRARNYPDIRHTTHGFRVCIAKKH